ncbi:MAG: ferritin family protein [Dehalococcoidia bacterium]|nr:ferritin family protein [Dehalococcoidia bacterium]
MEAKVDNLVEEELLEILVDAIEDEKRSQSRYTQALAQARSPESQALFQDLIDREREHQRLLEERYDQIKKKLEVKIIGKWSRWMRNGSG